jgi:hypothetical protein
MKIRPHPRLANVHVGDEVYSLAQQLSARVADVFPAAVCVALDTSTMAGPIDVTQALQLWRADDIENLSVCRWCGTREQLRDVASPDGRPSRGCPACVPDPSTPPPLPPR